MVFPMMKVARSGFCEKDVRTHPLTGAADSTKVSRVGIPIAQGQKLRSRKSKDSQPGLWPAAPCRTPHCCSCEPKSLE